LLNDDDFESEVEIERQRRYALEKNNDKNNKKRPRNKNNYNNSNNKRKTPSSAATTESAAAAKKNTAASLPRSNKKQKKASTATPASDAPVFMPPLPPAYNMFQPNPFYIHPAAAAASAAARAPLHPMTLTTMGGYPLQPYYGMMPPPIAAPAAAFPTLPSTTTTAPEAAKKKPPPPPAPKDDGAEGGNPAAPAPRKSASPASRRKGKGKVVTDAVEDIVVVDPVAAAVAKAAAKAVAKATTAHKLKKQALFEANLLKVQEFKAEHGHLNLFSVSSTSPEMHDLYAWIARQKIEWNKFKRGEASALNLEKIQQLIDVGLGTSQGPKNCKREQDEKSWDEYFERLVKFRNEHGNMDLLKKGSKKTESAELHKLATWMDTQRGNFKRRQHRAATGEKKKGGCMTDAQLERLCSIGFRFTNKQSTFEEYVVYRRYYYCVVLVSFSLSLSHCASYDGMLTYIFQCC
jgi:Helicase associated domain